ncbi:MAG TPA: hypothetical protein VF137_05350 [Candidatus Dormibacteraeota bacterium]
MFVRYYVIVDRPLDDCRQVLMRSPEEWLPNQVRASQEPAAQLLARVGFSLVSLDIRKRAVVNLGDPVRVGDWLHIPVSWGAQRASQLFPQFEGELQLVPISAGETKVAIAGTYDPPLGDVGRTVDNLLLHTVAEATVKDFVEGVARRMRAGSVGRRPRTGPAQDGPNASPAGVEIPVESGKQMLTSAEEVTT